MKDQKRLSSHQTDLSWNQPAISIEQLKVSMHQLFTGGLFRLEWLCLEDS
jgi:hypothetical protein